MGVEVSVAMSGRLEPRDWWSAKPCLLAAAFEILRTQSAFLTLREVFYGAARSDELVRRVRITEPVAAARPASWSSTACSDAGQTTIPANAPVTATAYRDGRRAVFQSSSR
jgi:hypothetical protein